MAGRESSDKARQHVVSASEAGERVDRLVARLSGCGRSGARRLLEAGAVRLNGGRASKRTLLRAGDRLELDGRAARTGVAPNPELPLVVVYEDASIVVVDKPAGMHCHPLDPGDRATLVSAMLARYPELAALGYSPLEPGLLHRIDCDTSGLVLFARNAVVFEHFARALRPTRPSPPSGDSVSREREGTRAAAGVGGEVLRKRYLALCAGDVIAPAVHRAQVVARGARVRITSSAERGARPIETAVLGAERVGDRYSLAELGVTSAARHQLRAHLAALDHPIAGDALYGGPELPGLSRHFLHASYLWLALPGRAEPLELRSALPPELRDALDAAARAR